MRTNKSTLWVCCVAEALGTFLLVFFGCGSVHTAVLAEAQSGIWQVAVVWGGAITVALYIIGGISGAHINPAISIAFALWGRFPWRRVPAYVASQVLGAFMAAGVLFLFFNAYLEEKERVKGVRRGEPGSEITAMCYGEYFPNPGPLASTAKAYDPEEHARFNQRVQEPLACAVEFLGTLILALVVFALTDERSVAAPAGKLAPVLIGLTIAILISVLAPLTQACFNPARDFGPRLFAALVGWGRIALPGRGTGFLTVYILSPLIGACLGGGLYMRLLAPGLPAPEPEKSTVL
jgi:glycerol uptake facilitator protein